MPLHKLKYYSLAFNGFSEAALVWSWRFKPRAFLPRTPPPRRGGSGFRKVDSVLRCFADERTRVLCYKVLRYDVSLPSPANNFFGKLVELSQVSFRLQMSGGLQTQEGGAVRSGVSTSARVQGPHLCFELWTTRPCCVPLQGLPSSSLRTRPAH